MFDLFVIINKKQVKATMRQHDTPSKWGAGLKTMPNNAKEAEREKDSWIVDRCIIQ